MASSVCGALAAVMLCLAPAPVRAETNSTKDVQGLTPEEGVVLARAYAADDLITMRAIVVSAIATASDKSTAIIKDVVAIAPNRANEIAKGAATVFPSMKDRIFAAIYPKAAKTAQTESGAPASQAPNAPADAAKAPTPSERHEEWYGKWSGETALGGSYTNSVQNTLTASAQIKLKQKIQKWTNTAGLQFDYGKVDDKTNVHKFELDGRGQREFDEALYGYLLGNYLDDRFSGYDYQVTEGIGVGYKLIDWEKFDLDIEGGPSIRQSRISATDQLTNELLGRAATRMKWNISDTASFSNETEFLFTSNAFEINSESGGNLRGQSETANTSNLDMQILGNLSARLTYEIHYRSDPQENAKSTESVAKASLVHSF